MRIQTAHVAEALATLRTATPAEIDATLFPLMNQAAHTYSNIQRLRGMVQRGYEVQDKIDALVPVLVELEQQVYLLESVYEMRGTWTRAYKVTNTGGHIHRSRGCTTCFDTTQFAIVPQVSGMDEAEIVALAGEAACTVCYPSAPVDTLKQKCMLFTQEEIEAREAKAAEKASRAAAKAAKAIANPDGTRLKVHSVCGVIETEVSAQRAYVELTVNATSGYYPNLALEYGQDAEVILVALAHKRGKDVDELRIELTDKVIAKAKRDDSPQAVAAARANRTYLLQKTSLKNRA